MFAHLVARPDDAIDLAAAALFIAEREYPDLDVGAYLERLDALAARARARGGDVEAVRAVLFDELSLRGNADDYYDARNSFLNDVLDRGLGIPITLSVVFLEVGWRLDLPVEGLGYPGHFLVGAGRLVLDCFDGGAPVDPPAGPRPVAGKRAILARMLANLSRIEPVRPWIAELQAALRAAPRGVAPPS
jgi:regulator of sirC expression with transglutaminase-like and TPR domain